MRTYQKLQNIFFLNILNIVALFSCVKYTENRPSKNPSYLRVFNSITYQTNPFTKDLPSPFLVFILDPVFDKSGIPTGGSFVGDYLDQRDLYSNSYASKAANVGTLSNKDFPGTNPIITAPIINGFDLSAWAQVPSGSHHVLILGRPRSDTSFLNLRASEKKSILIDTTINLQEGEVYTAEALILDETAGKAGLYLRKEDFIHRKFSSNQNYFQLFNLSANHPSPQVNQIYPFVDSLNFYISEYTSTCGIPNPSLTQYVCSFSYMPNLHDIYFRTLNGKFLNTAPYDSIAQLDSTYYALPNGTFKDYRYRPTIVMEFHQLSSNPLSLYRPGYLFFSDDFNSPDPTIQKSYIQDLNFGLFYNFYQLLPSMTLPVSYGNQIRPNSTLNIIEFINDRAFMMQISRSYSNSTL